MGQITLENLSDKLAEDIKLAVELVDKEASSTELGLVKIDNDTIKFNSSGQLYAVDDGSGGGGLQPSDIIDNLTTQDVSKVLSANQGYVLDQKIDKTKTDITNEYTTAISNITNGTTEIKGVVKTINSQAPDVNGNIDISTGGVTDVYTKAETDAKLTTAKTEVNAYTDTEVDKVQANLTSHEKAVATDTDLGHIKIDNVTIKNNASGQIESLFTPTDKTKLDGIKEGANNYILPPATPNILGGIKPDDSTIKVSGEGIIESINIKGLTITPRDINAWLTGTASNIQTQIDNVRDSITGLVGGMVYLGSVPNYASITTTHLTPNNGDVVVVLADETKGGARTLYVYSTQWEFIGNFEMADEFIKLIDTPNSYVGQDGKYVRVNETTSKLEFSDVDTYTKSEIDSKISGATPVIPDASITQKGIVQLTNSAIGTSEALALTQKGASTLNDALTTEINSVNSQLTNHSTLEASTTVLGHVTVDGTTIIADGGKISLSPSVLEAPKTRKFTTTTTEPTPGVFIYKTSIPILASDDLDVNYNSTALSEGEWEVVDDGGEIVIKLKVEQAETKQHNNVSGRIYRGFNTIS